MGEGEVTELKPYAWLCSGKGDGWEEKDKIVRDPELAAQYMAQPDKWKVRPLYLGPPAAVPEGGIVDTPLDWTDRSDGSSFAITPFGTYRVDPPDFDDGVTSYRWSYCFDEYYDEGEYSCDNRDQGKALAQVHWDERVSSIFRVRNVTAAPPPSTDGDGWRPIETAPKDGTRILAYYKDELGIEWYGIRRWDNGEIHVGWVDEWRSPVWEKPTHWQPLPAAPTEASDE